MDDMIKSRVREVAEENGVKSSYELQHRIGLAPTVALRLWRDEVTRFSRETLEKLCREFDCQVGDLLVYVREKKGGKK
jgi:putative transcriptional regulator